GFPVGPVIFPDGRLVFCAGNTGELLLWDGAAVSTFAVTGGSPWGAVLGADGAIYVTQGGNVPGSGDTSTVSGIQRVMPDGTVELIFSEVAGYDLYGPNDLAFGPDGRLYFTESGSEQDFRFDVRSPGRLFAVGRSGAGEMLLELPGVYPNGIAFDAAQQLYWTESMKHRVCRLNASGEPETFCQLSDGHVPDGMAFAADGRLFAPSRLNALPDAPAARAWTRGQLAVWPVSQPARGAGWPSRKSASWLDVRGLIWSGSGTPTCARASGRPARSPTRTKP